MGVVSRKQARSAQLIGKHYPQLQEPATGKPQAQTERLRRSLGVVSRKQARSAQLIGKHYPQLQEPATGKPQAQTERLRRSLGINARNPGCLIFQGLPGLYLAL